MIGLKNCIPYIKSTGGKTNLWHFPLSKGAAKLCLEVASPVGCDGGAVGDNARIMSMACTEIHNSKKYHTMQHNRISITEITKSYCYYCITVIFYFTLFS